MRLSVFTSMLDYTVTTLDVTLLEIPVQSHSIADPLGVGIDYQLKLPSTIYLNVSVYSCFKMKTDKIWLCWRTASQTHIKFPIPFLLLQGGICLIRAFIDISLPLLHLLYHCIHVIKN